MAHKEFIIAGAVESLYHRGLFDGLGHRSNRRRSPALLARRMRASSRAYPFAPVPESHIPVTCRFFDFGPSGPVPTPD